MAEKTITLARTVIEHSPNFKGNVTVRRGDVAITVPMLELERVVGEKVRYDSIEALAVMKIPDLLRKL